MELTTDLKIGQIVKSKAGRDKQKVFIICSILDEQHVLVCDGDLRKLSSPKKKKVKHLVIYNKVLIELSDKIQRNENLDDALVKKLLEPFTQDAYKETEVE